ncbi:unnamed protein product, partial [Phaeothamnion confervicola]
WSLAASGGATCERTINAHKDGVNGLALACDGVSLLSGGVDATVRRWRLSDGECTLILARHFTDSVTCIAANASLFVAGSLDRSLRVFSPDGTVLHIHRSV